MSFPNRLEPLFTQGCEDAEGGCTCGGGGTGKVDWAWTTATLFIITKITVNEIVVNVTWFLISVADLACKLLVCVTPPIYLTIKLKDDLKRLTAIFFYGYACRLSGGRIFWLIY